MLVAFAERAAADHSTVDIWHHGGAMARGGADETAYGRRDARYLVTLEDICLLLVDDADNIAWGRDCISALSAENTGGLYQNFPGFAGEAPAEMLYGENLQRLQELERRFDPENLFRRNQNIRPSGTGGA